ncbi:MAG: hypothetical protein U0V04_03900 [Spirosomataceae bacterium]
MSDYGSIMVLKPKGKSAFTAEEKQEIIRFVTELQDEGYGEPDGGEPYNLSISETENGLEIIMSEYWDGDGDDQENFEFAQEMDEINMDEVKTYFEQNLKVSFDIEFLFERW